MSGMNYRFPPTYQGLLQRQSHKQRPVYRYNMGDNGYSDLYFDYQFNDPQIGMGFGERAWPHGRRFIIDSRSGYVDEFDGPEGQREDVGAREHGRASPGYGILGDSIRQGGSRERKSSLPFKKAMSKLYQQIVKSEEFYRSFKTEYDQDIERVQKYASDESLLALWVSRLKGKKDSKSGAVEDSRDEKLIEAAERLPIVKEKLRDAFEEVLDSNMKIGRSIDRKEQIELDSAKRLRQKVSLAASQMSSLLDLVVSGPEHCDSLLAEFVKLKFLFDPEDEKDQGGSNNEATSSAQWTG